MSEKSTIEWTDATWNPVTGCTKVSQGCKNCYAERKFPRIYPGRAFTDVQIHMDRLEQPLRWQKPRRIFVNSMSDLFHESIADEYIDRFFAIMGMAPQHTFQVLTKRQNRMLAWATRTVMDVRLQTAKGRVRNTPWGNSKVPWPLPNVWLGVSIENQATADERIPILLQTPAAVRFVSYEPALGPLKLAPSWFRNSPPQFSQRQVFLGGIDWLIAGGESGPGARPSHPEWFRSVRDQCQAAGVPFFFKQWGEWKPLSTTEGMQVTPFGDYSITPDAVGKRIFYPNFLKLGKKRAGRLLDGREWNEYPSVDLPTA